MPTYEYQCAKGHQFEVFHKINDRPRARCPVCGGRASRVISGGAGLIFKGSGFYITDYGKDGKGPRKEAETAAAPAEAAAKPAEGDTAKPAPATPKPEQKPAKKGGKPPA